MSTPNRASILNKTFRILRKHYKWVGPLRDRTVLEHLLYACCLENSQPEAADEAYARLQESYYDWNEIRVTSVGELAEILNPLADPADAATRLKQVLQVVFETYYAFDLEHLQKQNLGKAIKELEKYKGTTSFSVDYVTQNGLGGHSIATNQGVIKTLTVLGIVSEAEARKRHLPGMARAISKSKGVEFSSLLHQLGTDFQMTPFSSRVRAILLEITADAKSRFPKRKTRKKETPPAEKKTAKPAEPLADQAVAKTAAIKKSAAAKTVVKKTTGRKASVEKGATKKKTEKKHASRQSQKSVSKKPAKAKASKRKNTPSKKTKKKTAARQSAKRKPR
ncbi:MAG TPA: hypothetical protein EYN70_14700 [Planctomycetaceae bacterium]|nr:hypothetical protein [Planctomycetaceae bacterium]